MKKVKLIAFLSALAAGLLLFMFLRQAAEPVEIPKTTVIAAAVDINENTVIEASMLVYKDVPTEAVLQGGVYDMDAIVGKVANSRILTGEQILARRLVSLGSKEDIGALSYTISDGMRAMTVSVNDSSGFSGMLIPGNRIDIVLLYEVEKETTAQDEAAGETESVMTARLLMQNITILATGSVFDKSKETEEQKENGYANVTLELTPEQAVELSLAQNVGQISFLLRSPIDAAEADGGIIDAEVLN